MYARLNMLEGRSSGGSIAVAVDGNVRALPRMNAGGAGDARDEHSLSARTHASPPEALHIHGIHMLLLGIGIPEN